MGFKIDYEIGLFYKECIIEVGDSTVPVYGIFMTRFFMSFEDANWLFEHLDAHKVMKQAVEACSDVFGPQIDENGMVRWYYDCLEETLYLARQHDGPLLKLIL